MRFNLYSFLSLIAFLIAFFFAIFVLIKGRRKKENISFSLATIFTAIWTSFPFLTSLSSTSYKALSIGRFLYIFAAFVPSLWYRFMLVISSKDNKTPAFYYKLFYPFIAVSVFFAFLSYHPAFIKGVIRFAPHFSPSVGSLYIYFMFFFFLVFSLIFLRLISQIRKSYGYKRNQLLYIFWAYLFGVISGLIHFIAAYTNHEPIPHDIFIIIYPCILGYAILKHRLMDITIAITRTGIFIAIYTFVLGLPFILIAFGKHYLMDLWGENWWKVPLALLVILATTGPFLYIYFQKRAENRLLHQQLRYRETLRDAARGMTRVRNLNKLLNLIVHIVTKTVDVSYSGIYLFDINSEKFLLKAGRNLKKEQITSVDKNSHLVIYLKEHRRPLLWEEVRRRVREKPDSTLAQLEECLISLNASLIIPAFLEDKLMGFLILGEKRSGKSYSLEDLDTFSLLAYHAGLAIENAMLYENMEEQIKQKTRELVEIQKQLIQAEKLATVGTLAGGVAHEINNPLAAILTSVQMLLMEKGDNIYADRESLEIIEAATKRCRDIVLKLMTYARKPLRHSQPRIEVVNLREVIYSSIGLLSYQLKQENIDIVFFLEAETYTIKADANELQQVFTNMILNARDAIREKKCDKGLISLHLFKRNSTVFVKIKDNGVGMQLEIVKKIFDPFFTTKDVGKGTGLGLSICQSIVESYQGKIEVESKVGEGTTFIISFPEVDTKTLKKEEKERETKIPA